MSDTALTFPLTNLPTHEGAPLPPDAPVIIAARRTPITTKGGRLAQFQAEELAAVVLRAVVDDAARVLGREFPIGDVILGNCMGPGGNTARVASLAAGLDVRIPGMTIDRQCGSGLAAIVTAADSISAGDARLRIAGGVESASTAPTRTAAGTGAPYSRAAFAPDGFPDPEMGPAAEHLAGLHGITRERQDAYALRSHDLAVAAQHRGAFDEELVALSDVVADDGPRSGMSAMLGRFPALHGGTVTAGNSCRISDGAAAVAIVPAALRGTAPGLVIRATATIGCDPATPGIGPVDAVRDLLDRTGLTLDDMAAFELVEAFASQSLAVWQELGLADEDGVDPRVCADGGALALGHPWGASGAVGLVRLFSRLVRADAPAGARGIATVAVGGGLGIAALVEVVR
ncbi:thiolase family protein [Plantibacter sp. YIM 135249]|uniref:thiolase family protein n=1 Tax=Plantibacter sp. YIM 135249 TaxID=3423918 RepID=UPI003D32BE53